GPAQRRGGREDFVAAKQRLESDREEQRLECGREDASRGETALAESVYNV
ncbi:hypothetical protein BVRB_034880, partial [Beta vulgaris subsp. vulgaris]